MSLILFIECDVCHATEKWDYSPFQKLPYGWHHCDDIHVCSAKCLAGYSSTCEKYGIPQKQA